MKYCPQCGVELNVQGRFCWQCGTPLPSGDLASIGIDPNADLEQQITAGFFKVLKKNIEEQQNPERWQAFSERVYDSGFRDILQRRVAHLAAKLQTGANAAAPLAGKQITDLWENLSDHFMISFGQDLCETVFPEKILRYLETEWEHVDLYRMIMDYLDLQDEPVSHYTDFLAMPVEKLKNAGRTFLKPDKGERIFLIVDLSILGSCNEGFALTEKGLYWKAQLNRAHRVTFIGLNDIRKERDWITINGYFFNASPSLNIKMLKLLKRIKRFLE